MWLRVWITPRRGGAAPFGMLVSQTAATFAAEGLVSGRQHRSYANLFTLAVDEVVPVLVT
jgi:hypothetical protein